MFGSSKKPEEIAVVFDIGNGSIGAAAVAFNRNDRPTILYTRREPITFMPKVSSTRLLQSMLKLLRNVAEHIQKEELVKTQHSIFGQRKIRDVFCIFSSPWYLSQTKVLRIEKDKPFTITRNTTDDLIKREQEKFNEAMKNGKYEKIFGANVGLLEKKVISTRVNGYDTAEPIGKTAKELEITFFTSFIAPEILKGVENILSHVFPFKKIQFFSYALASYSAVRDLFPNKDNFLFFDVTGEVTDIMLTHEGVLVETITVPIGRATMLRKMVHELGIPAEVALSFLSMHGSKNVDEKFAEQISPLAGQIQQDWLNGVYNAFSELEKTYSLPKTIYLTADNDTAGYFIDPLRRNMPIELNIPQNSFDVIYLSQEKISSALAYASHDVERDVFLGLENVFISKIIST